MPDYSDDALRSDFNRGLKKAFDTIFDRFYERLTVFATGIVGDKEAAKDIVQEVFVELAEKQGTIDRIQNFQAFLFIAARNRCANYLRREKRLTARNRLFMERLDDPDELANDRLDDEFLCALHQSMERLPGRSRQIVELYYIEEMRYKEIAEKLHISDRTVESTLRSALLKLRQSLAKNIASFLLFLW
jgi:RNA polymerase sigma-70 factor (family 1)